jgi:hypothetical protein
VKNINIPVKALAKLASFMERVPTIVETLSAPQSAAPAVNRKEAEARAADLVKYAGLDPARQAEFANFICTNEGSLKTIQSLTNKIAALQAEVAQTRNLAVGGPSTTKVSNTGNGSSTAAWCEALLG